MEKIVFATKNEGKMVELRKILADLPVQVVSEKEAGLDVDVVEDGATFEENALKKARAVMEQSGRLTLADDSGLEIDYLDKQPGVNSARFMGEKTSYTIKNQYFIDQLAGVPLEQRTARFVCAAAAAFPDGRTLVARGTIEGYIGYRPQGEGGFGYDPIFYLPGTETSTAELSLEAKNKISHRGKAFSALKKLLKPELEKDREKGRQE
mgnify:CR=1 FL=1